MAGHCSLCGKETPDGQYCPEDAFVRKVTELVIKWQLAQNRNIKLMLQDVKELVKKGGE